MFDFLCYNEAYHEQKQRGGDMSNISISSSSKFNSTIIPNAFIDHYMSDANGSYVKVYIYLLRCLQFPNDKLSIAFLADKLDETEKDISRALNYWEKQNLIVLTKESSGNITNITIKNLEETRQEKPETFCVSSESAPCEAVQQESVSTTSLPSKPSPVARKLPKIRTKPNYTPAQINALIEISEVNSLFNNIAAILMRPLRSSEQQLVLYLYESLGFSSELVTYLFEYCKSIGKTSTSYIEAVAISWDENDIGTVEKAVEFSSSRNSVYSAVSKAFGFNRPLVEVERTFVDRWQKDYCFDISLITEACNRTVLAINKPNFEYANTILDSWHKKGIQGLNDISRLDQERADQRTRTISFPMEKRPVKQTNNRFNQFPQRAYSEEDYASMEQLLLSKHQG